MGRAPLGRTPGHPARARQPGGAAIHEERSAGPALRSCGTCRQRRALARIPGKSRWAPGGGRPPVGKAARLESEPCATFRRLADQGPTAQPRRRGRPRACPPRAESAADRASRRSAPTKKIQQKLAPAGKFVVIPLASGRQRATYLAEYCRVGKTMHRRMGLGAGGRLLKKDRESSRDHPGPNFWDQRRRQKSPPPWPTSGKGSKKDVKRIRSKPECL